MQTTCIIIRIHSTISKNVNKWQKFRNIDSLYKNDGVTEHVCQYLNMNETMENHLHQLGYISRLNIWMQQKSNKASLMNCISISDSKW